MQKSVFAFAALAVLVVCSLDLRAQPNPVPNASFETWSDNPGWGSLPDEWFGDPRVDGVFQSYYAHSGTSALGGAVKFTGGKIETPFMVSIDPAGNEGFALNFKPASFDVYYEFTSVGNDAIDLEVFFMNKGNQLAAAIYHDSTSHGSYVHVSIPPDFPFSKIPDTAVIYFDIVNSQGPAHVGSSYIIDDVSIVGSESVARPSDAAAIELEQNYPNPVHRSTTIQYSIPEDDHVTLDIVTLTGERVAVLEDDRASAGNHEVAFDAEHRASGSYVCRLSTAAHGTVSRILQVEH